MPDMTPYGGDAGQRISNALLGFGATILDLRKAYDALEFQREKEKRDYDLAKQGLALREETAAALAQNAELRAQTALERVQLQQQEFTGRMQRAGFTQTKEGEFAPTPLGELPLAQRAEVERKNAAAAKSLTDKLLAEKNADRRFAHLETSDFATVMTLRFNLSQKTQEIRNHIASLRARGPEMAARADEEERGLKDTESIQQQVEQFVGRQAAATAPAAAPAAPVPAPAGAPAAPATVPPVPTTGVTISVAGQTYPVLPKTADDDTVYSQVIHAFLASGGQDEAIHEWFRQWMKANGITKQAASADFVANVKRFATQVQSQSQR